MVVGQDETTFLLKEGDSFLNVVSPGCVLGAECLQVFFLGPMMAYLIST